MRNPVPDPVVEGRLFDLRPEVLRSHGLSVGIEGEVRILHAGPPLAEGLGSPASGGAPRPAGSFVAPPLAQGSGPFLPGRPVQKVLVNLFHKAGNLRILDFSPDHAPFRRRHGQVLFRPRNAHVAEAALLFDFLVRVLGGNGHERGEETVLHAGHVDIGKLQPLGPVQGHKENVLVPFREIVDVCNQSHFLEETGKGRLLGLVLVGDGLVIEFIQVLEPGLGLVCVLGLESIRVSGGLENLFNEQGNRGGNRLFLQFLNQVGETLDFSGCGLHGRIDGSGQQAFVEGLPVRLGPGGGFGHRSRTDSPLGDIDDPLHGKVVRPVVDDLHIGQNVLDLLPGVEVDPAHDLIRDIFLNEFFLENPGLGVGPVEDGVLAEAVLLLPGLAFDVIRDVLGLFIGGVKKLESNLVPGPVLGPEGFRLSSGVMTDYIVCRIEDCFCRTIILLQADDSRVGEVVLEVQDVLYIGPAELVDGLIIVADDAEVVSSPGQEADQLELGRIRVLILVHHDVLEFPLVVLSRLGVRLQELHGL